VNRAASPNTSVPRTSVAVLSLLVLGASLARSFEPSATAARWRRLVGALGGDVRPQGETAGFWFDPDFAAFLAEVKRRTPPNATVAVIVPYRPDMYRYQAYYQLAPRRVVEDRWKDEAAFIATYRTDAARGPGGAAIAHGQLCWRHSGRAPRSAGRSRAT
jgi:hypothetical protein